MAMRNRLLLCILVALVFLTGCQSRHPANVKPVTLGIFEVMDCKTSGTAPMSLKGELRNTVWLQPATVNV